MKKFLPIQTPEQIQILANLASEIWHEYFPCILPSEQIDYMINKFQSFSALTEQIVSGY